MMTTEIRIMMLGCICEGVGLLARQAGWLAAELGHQILTFSRYMILFVYPGISNALKLPW